MSDWQFGIQEGGEFDGCKYVKLVGLGIDKTTKLSLGNPHQRDADGYSKMFANPKDRYCLVKIVEFYITNHLRPAYASVGLADGPFFVRRA